MKKWSIRKSGSGGSEASGKCKGPEVRRFGRVRKSNSTYDQSRLPRGQEQGMGMQLERWSGSGPIWGPAGSDKKFEVYCRWVGQSLEGFELRMNIIRLMLHQDLSAHLLEKHVGEKDVSRMTSYEIFL